MFTWYTVISQPLITRANTVLTLLWFDTSFSTGTTWTQELVWQIHNEGKFSKDNIGRRVPFLEFATVDITTKPDFEALPSPRLIKSHLTADIIPKGSDESSRCKYIYVSRNPKDVCVSLFFFIKDMMGAETITENAYDGPWECFVDLFIEGDGGLDYYWNTKFFLFENHCYGNSFSGLVIVQ